MTPTRVQVRWSPAERPLSGNASKQVFGRDRGRQQAGNDCDRLWAGRSAGTLAVWLTIVHLRRGTGCPDS